LRFVKFDWPLTDHGAELFSMKHRTKDTYLKQVYDFIKDILVVCPSCSGKALVIASEHPFQQSNKLEIKLICPDCGHNRKLEEKQDVVLFADAPKKITGSHIIIGDAIDPYFHLPLWLMADCCGNTLWAYNLEHLEFLKQHVAAGLRERNTQVKANKSLGSRLPKWMTAAKNRETVLKAIDLLKKKS
jgi:DNA-directed RNA polymerase subunit RPC12/RpoP